MDNMDGHVFQTLIPWLRKQEVEIPSKWNGKARLQPDGERQRMRIEERFRQCWMRISTQTWKQRVRGGMTRAPLRVWMEERGDHVMLELGRGVKFSFVWERWVEMNHGSVSEDEILEHKKLLDHFVICPVDKYPQEGIIMCAYMYGKVLEELSAGMEDVPTNMINRVFARIGAAGQTLRHLPFAALRGAATHKFGCLRGWVKKKSFTEEMSWSTLKWRPLVSFREHRWRKLLSLLSRY
jgi:hypothetical protein